MTYKSIDDERFYLDTKLDFVPKRFDNIPKLKQQYEYFKQNKTMFYNSNI